MTPSPPPFFGSRAVCLTIMGLWVGIPILGGSPGANFFLGPPTES